MSSDNQYISQDIIQRMLLVSVDHIQQKLYDINYGFDGISLLSDATKINKESIPLLSTRQQQIFSDCIIDPQAAKNLFPDNITDEPLDSLYTINNLISMHIKAGDAWRIYYFDIDEVNKLNYGKFFISKITLRNKPKDSFTLKTNYQINLKINFSTFDDIIDDNLTMKQVGGTDTIKVPLLYLLYKFMKNENFTKEIPDTYGIFYTQKLIFNQNHERFKDLKDLCNGNVIYKNYHLSFHKHSFEVFKDNSPFYKMYDNELNIDFISYETEGSLEINKNVPSSDGNLYSIIFGENTELKKQVDKINTDILALTNQISACQQLTSLDKSKKIDKSAVENIQEKLTNLIKIRKELYVQINERLVKRILSICKRYSIKDIPYENLGIYLESNTDWTKFFGWSAVLLGSLALYALPGLGPTLANIATATIGNMALTGLLSALYATTLISKDFENEKARADIFKSTLELATDSNILTLKNKQAAGSNETKGIVGTGLNEENRKKANEEMKDAFDAFGSIGLRNEKQKKELIDLKFIPFGEIMSLVTRLMHNTRIISGGYVMSVSGNPTFINFSSIPISLNRFAKFLYKFIVQMERNLYYSSELFFRDCYENLIKTAIYDASGYLSKVKDYVSKDLKISTSLHNLNLTPSFKKELTKINLLNENDFNTFKKKFLTSKNFNFQGQNDKPEIWKFITIGSFENIMYHNFFKNYDQKATNFNTIKFQNYINETYGIPCILTKKLSENESILRKKHLSFTKLDNPSITTGNMIAQSSILRFPYNVKAELKPLFSFFVSPGSYIFVAPPTTLPNREINIFGYGGLYIILGSEFEYEFQRIENDKITLPNFSSKYIIDAMSITSGIEIKQPDIKVIEQKCTTTESITVDYNLISN